LQEKLTARWIGRCLEHDKAVQVDAARNQVHNDTVQGAD
jgi:hypothetical protein